MIQIIPNVHPIFVHFTIALFSSSVGFYVLSYLLGHLKTKPRAILLATEFEIVGRWCLWAAALITIGTLLAGDQAYDTVKHDAISHVAMNEHRNWALSTATCIFLMTLWSFWRYYKRKIVTISFVIGLLIIQGMLVSTAWHGAELVFRYGLGVISLPQAEEVGHHHHHHGAEIVQPHEHHHAN